MLTIFDSLRELTLLAVTLRLFLAVLCGGIIGMERTLHRRPAGLRTHILVCTGAALTTLTGQYLYLYLHYFTDMARLGAQVVAGIGFLGAGTIIISRQRVKGLTTAAGLWAAAIIGLACGAGFYEGAIVATFLVELAATVFLDLEKYVINRTSNINIFLEDSQPQALEDALSYCRSSDIKIMHLEISRNQEPAEAVIALLSLRLPPQLKTEEVLAVLGGIESVLVAEKF